MKGVTAGMSKYELIRRLVRKAMSSKCTQKVSAAGLDEEGKFVACCFNSPFIHRPGGSTHAEQALISRYRKGGLSTIIICRTNNSGWLLPIDPCPQCRQLAEKYNISLLRVRDIAEVQPQTSYS
jgi:cytidine deaminase